MANNRGWFGNYGIATQWNMMHNHSFENYVATWKNVCGIVLSEGRILNYVYVLIETFKIMLISGQMKNQWFPRVVKTSLISHFCSSKYYFSFQAMGVLVAQPCLTVCNSMSWSLSPFSVHGILQAKNTGMGCYAFLQGVFLTKGLNLCLSAALALQAYSLPTEPPEKPRWKH